MKRNVFSCLLKEAREVAVVTLVGRLFHARAAVTRKDRSPMVRSRILGTIRRCWEPDHSRRSSRVTRVLLVRSLSLCFVLSSVVWRHTSGLASTICSSGALSLSTSPRRWWPTQPFSSTSTRASRSTAWIRQTSGSQCCSVSLFCSCQFSPKSSTTLTLGRHSPTK